MTAAISWTNHLFGNSTIIASVASSSQVTSVAFDPAYPSINAFDRDPSRVSRVNYTRNAVAGGYVFVLWQFATTLATQKLGRVMAALNCRIPAAATQVTLKAYDYLGAGVFEQVYMAADLVPIPGTTDRYNLYALHTVDANVALIGLLIFVPPSTADYVEVGEAWLGPALVLPAIDSRWGSLPVDGSEVARGRGGSFSAQVLPRRRRVRASLSARDYNTTWGTPGSSATPSVRQLLGEVGRSAPMVLIPRNTNAHTLQVMSVFGLLQDLKEVGHQDGDYYTAELVVDEVR